MDLIADHIRWCDSDGAEGRPSVFDGADMRGLKSLAGKRLTAFQARGATMYGVDLEGAELQGARLERADLRMACLRGADLRGADLTGARLNNADLRDCKLGPLLIGKNRLMQASLAASKVRYADLRGADLRHVRGTGADFSYSRLDTADVQKAQFSGSCFTGAVIDNDFIKDIADAEGAVDLNAA